MVDSHASSGSCQSQLQKICALCTMPARYKCPRCATSACSLPCSRKHKQDTGCTGERDKVQYVPMNAYDWGTMMRDYCYLEDVGRKVSNWGTQIVRGGYLDNVGSHKPASRRKSSSGRKPRSKRDVLRDHLEKLGIDVDFLPAGMERRRLNQSTFDQKSKCPLLTIELVLYPPTTIASISSSPRQSYKMLSHHNSLSAVLLSMLQRQVSSTLSKQKEDAPDWLSSMVTPHPEAPECFVPPHCYIRANTEFPQDPNARYYHELEPTLSLGELLQRTSFIEFPTIHVFDPEASSFCGIVVDKSGSIVRALGSRDKVARVRMRLDKTAGVSTVFNLVGGYGSESNSPSGEETEKHMTGLATLEAYSGSDEEITPKNIDGEDECLDSDVDVLAKADHFDFDQDKSLEFPREIHSTADEDILDWGDEWDIDAEE